MISGARRTAIGATLGLACATAIPPKTSSLAKTAIFGGGYVLEILWYGLVVWVLSSGPALMAYRQFGVWNKRVMGMARIVFGVCLF